MGRVFAIISGKGGVGKSTLATALAEYYASQGKGVVLLDGDTGLRCVDLMLGLQDRVVFDLGDVAEKKCEIDQALIAHPALPGLRLLAAPQMMSASDVKRKAMRRIVNEISGQTDILLMDAPAGIGRGFKNTLGNLAEPVIIGTPDDVCIRDVERVAYVLTEMEEPRPVLVLNRVDRRLVHRGVMRAPLEIAKSLDIELVGIIPESQQVYRALLRGEGALDSGDLQVVSAVEVIAARLLGADAPLPEYRYSPILRFFNRRGEA
ncbi:MAG: P-loop NTPase [Clostridia bacterium]|nr:P-loop NTPase [Clostridia bacterium]